MTMSEESCAKSFQNNVDVDESVFKNIQCGFKGPSLESVRDIQNVDSELSLEAHKLHEVLENDSTQSQGVNCRLKSIHTPDPKQNEKCIPNSSQSIANNTINGISAERDVIATMESNTYSNALNLQATKCPATSTVSLNEQFCSDDKTTAVLNSAMSKSHENISLSNVNFSNNLVLNAKTDINPDKVLADYSIHKSKATAMHKIVNDNNQTPLEVRYSKIHKETLSQDLGSIVKNVHGIFSTVSGTFKNAYNISQKASQKINIAPKTVLNGKIMDEIFEDEQKFVKIDNQDLQNSDVNPVDKHESPKNVDMEKVECIVENESSQEQLHVVEKALSEQRRVTVGLQEKLKQQSLALLEKDNSFKELETQLDIMRRRLDQAEKDKDAAVMRYASVECATIEAKRLAETAQKAERAAVAEMELLNNKLRSAHAEKQRICQLYDDKCHELSNSEKEIAKLKEDLKELEGRLKWTQSKLRLEMDAFKDSTEKVGKLSQQVNELEASKDAAATNAADIVKAKQLETELKEVRASLILCRHEKDELEKRLFSTAEKLEVCNNELNESKRLLEEHKIKVEELSCSNERLEEEAAELASLRAQAALADTLASTLQRESERVSAMEADLIRERALSKTCMSREEAALAHVANVTRDYVDERARAADNEAKVTALTVDNTCLRERVTTLETENSKLEDALTQETSRRNKETRVLARKVAELTEELEEANKKLEWEKGEITVLKKKQTNAVKELNRELQRSLKRCEQLEAKIPHNDQDDSTRTGSISSLSSSEGTQMSQQQDETMQNGHSSDSVGDVQVREPDRQALIERIVSLQRAAARRSERCEFLEEHTRQLTVELRNKSRLLRHLISETPAGALTGGTSDQHKKDIARLGGGAMAAVWGGDPAGMTLELSIEMNRRLQAILEDTLLKNITLKDNMDTLGEEIARLKSSKVTKINK